MPCIKKKRIIKKGQKKRRRREAVWGRREREKGKRIFYFFLRSTKIGLTVSSEQETKFIHASRATRGYQNLGVSGREFLTWVISSLKAI